MKTDSERMPLVLRRTPRGLEAVTRAASDALAKYAIHSDVEVSIKKKRSLPQLKKYWAMLNNVVAATDAWPDAEHLHLALKMDLGYTTPVRTVDGKLILIPDSAAMSKMDSVQFKAFFDAAAKRLAEVCGFDPLSDMQEAA
jgi:hypothetical protein